MMGKHLQLRRHICTSTILMLISASHSCQDLECLRVQTVYEKSTHGGDMPVSVPEQLVKFLQKICMSHSCHDLKSMHDQ